jgi:sugar phosphate isomerase/epimerase
MSSSGKLKFGVDLVTFFHPGFWGGHDHAAIVEFARRTPRIFWNKMLDGVAASGVTGVELTFPPFDWKSAVATYGSVEGFAEALESRGLHLASGFFNDIASADDFSDAATQKMIVEAAVDYADFLAACGGEVMVAGLPLRQSPGVEPPAFFDLSEAQRLADLVNRVGAQVAARGVKFALHTEAHSVFAMARDIDLMMLLTDPVYVHFCPDTAHMVLVGGDPVQIVERHHERVAIAHWKDATGPMPADTPIGTDIHDRHRPYFCRLGTGRVDWPAWSRLLRDRGLTGWAILELDAAPDPVGDIADGLALVRQALMPIFL